MKKPGLKALIIIGFVIVFIIFTSVIYNISNKFFYNSLKNVFIEDNKNATEVASDYLIAAKETASKNAQIVVKNEMIFEAFVNKNFIKGLMAKRESPVLENYPIDKIKLMRIVNNLFGQLFGSSTHLYFEDFIEIFDENGKIATSVGNNKTEFFDKKEDIYISKAYDVSAIMTDQRLNAIEKKGDYYFVKGIQSIYLNEVYGVVVVNKPITTEFLKKMKKTTNRDIAIVENGKIFMSTLFDKDGNVIKGIEIKINENENKDEIVSKYFEKKINGETYGINAFAIKDFTNKTIAYMCVMNNIEVLNTLFKKSTEGFVGYMILATVCVFIIGIALLTIMLKPIEKIMAGIGRIQEGHYNEAINVKGAREIEILAESINNLSSRVYNREKEIIEKNEKLLEADKLKNEFMANTSHELRTPLNGIIGLADATLYNYREELPDDVATNLWMIVLSGKRLSNLVNDILDFEKLRNNDLFIERKTCDLRQIVDIVLTMSKPFTGKKQLKLVNEIPEEFSYVIGDENRLQQILYNLIGNAIKFTETGSVTIAAKSIDNNKIEVSITDTGIGIAKENFGKIFNDFEQVDGSTSREYGGTGLGLSITKKLVTLHGGEIYLTSEIGSGSTFYFTLDRSEKDEEELNTLLDIGVVVHSKKPEEIIEIIETANVNISKNKIKGKILIVDDEPINLAVMINYLQYENYEIESASNGIEALEILEKLQYKVDLVVLDVMMPKMSGYEVCSRLRKVFSLYDLPVLMLTAKVRPEDVEAGFMVGANDYLTKPVDRKELLARVSTLVSLKVAVTEAIENTKKYEREKQNQINLKESYEKVKSIESVISKVYTEKNPSVATKFMMTVLLEKKILNYKSAYYFDYNKDKNEFVGNLYISEYIRNDLSEAEYEKAVYEAQELEKEVKKSTLQKSAFDELITDWKEFKILSFLNLNIGSIKIEKCDIIPIIYENEIFGLLAAEYYNDNENVSVLEKDELINIFAKNLSIYYQNTKLEYEKLENEKLYAMVELAKAIVHEVKTPLVGIQGFARMIISKIKKNPEKISDELTLKIDDYVSKIIKETQRVDGMAQDLLDYAGINDVKLKLENVKVSEIINISMNILLEDISANSIELTTEYSSDNEIRMDFEKMCKVIFNITKNAIEASDFNKEKHTLKIAVSENNEMVDILFEDNGVGISEEHLKEIYKPLFSKKEQGTGLGLTIAKGIIEAHNGTITIDSKEEEWTKVKITLPLGKI